MEHRPQRHSRHVPSSRAKDSRPKIVMQRSQVCDLLRSKQQSQILEKSIMDEQVKKPIFRPIIVAIEEIPSFSYYLPNPINKGEGESRQKGAEDVGVEGISRACVDEQESGTCLLMGDNTP